MFIRGGGRQKRLLLLEDLGPVAPVPLPCLGVPLGAPQGNDTAVLRWCRTSDASASLPCLLLCVSVRINMRMKWVIKERRHTHLQRGGRWG